MRLGGMPRRVDSGGFGGKPRRQEASSVNGLPGTRVSQSTHTTTCHSKRADWWDNVRAACGYRQQPSPLLRRDHPLRGYPLHLQR